MSELAHVEPGGGPQAPPPRLWLGLVPIDRVTFAGALEAIAGLVERGRGGAVFTPNVDHVVKAEHDAAFRAAYAAADLSLADGKPLVWASRLLGAPVPEKVSGSDLVLPLTDLAARRGWRVYLFGGAPGDAERAADVLGGRGVRIVGVEAPRVDVGPAGEEGRREALARIAAARPHLLLVALGAPKQEIWIHRSRAELGAVVAVGVGASLAFIAGTLRRAPPWMSRAGLEWLFRLASEPRRLWRRYLVEDPAFVAVLARTWAGARRSARAPR